MSAQMESAGEPRLFDTLGDMNERRRERPRPDRPASAPARRRSSSNRRMYTITEAADLLGIGRSTAYELAQRGELEVVRIGGRRMVSPAVLEGLLGERPPPPSELIG